MAEQTLLLFQFLDLVGPRYWKDCTSSSCTSFIRISAVMAFTMTLLSTVLIFIQGGKFFHWRPWNLCRQQSGGYWDASPRLIWRCCGPIVYRTWFSQVRCWTGLGKVNILGVHHWPIGVGHNVPLGHGAASSSWSLDGVYQTFLHIGGEQYVPYCWCHNLSNAFFKLIKLWYIFLPW